MNDTPPALQRYVGLACWLAVLLTVLLIALKIISYGFLPPADARRHVAKPFAEKPYSQIVVMRPEYVVDHSPGWEWLLGVVHRAFGWDEDALMSFSIASLLLWVLCLPLLWMRRPESWAAAFLAALVAAPELMNRLSQARPYLVTVGVFMAILLAWSKDERRPGWPKIGLTLAGFALAIWMHGIWYMWVLVLLAFFLAQRWRTGLWLAGCWMAGAVVAGLLTGKPVSFLYEAVFQAHAIYAEHLPNWMLVTELQPATGEFGTLALLALFYCWLQRQDKFLPPLLRDPVFWMIVLAWILSFFASRFWTDWAGPAALVWLALRCDEVLPDYFAPSSRRRLLLCAVILTPLYLSATNDLGRRYSFSLDEMFIDAKESELRAWLPGRDGIFYADSMDFFYSTFYKNPRADWRYILGFEPALMLSEDLKIYHNIIRTGGAPAAYGPWIKKMRPQDRLAVERSFKPGLPQLEWKRAGDYWIGRLPPAPPPPAKKESN